jgi:hypothetical protein
VLQFGGGDPDERRLWFRAATEAPQKITSVRRRRLVSAASVGIPKSAQDKSPRKVSIRRDGEDFVVVSLVEDLVIFRDSNASALRKVCHSLHWDIAIDSCLPSTNRRKADSA